MAKRVIYQIDPKRRNPDGTYPDFIVSDYSDKQSRLKWLYHKVFRVKKHNAKKQNILFMLQFGFFLNFCRNTNYHALRGQGANDLTIDRKDNLQGYLPENIQTLSRLENIRKYNTIARRRAEKTIATQMKLFLDP